MDYFYSLLARQKRNSLRVGGLSLPAFQNLRVLTRHELDEARQFLIEIIQNVAHTRASRMETMPFEQLDQLAIRNRKPF